MRYVLCSVPLDVEFDENWSFEVVWVGLVVFYEEIVKIVNLGYFSKKWIFGEICLIITFALVFKI